MYIHAVKVVRTENVGLLASNEEMKNWRKYIGFVVHFAFPR